jgi:hypothetical protein
MPVQYVRKWGTYFRVVRLKTHEGVQAVVHEQDRSGPSPRPSPGVPGEGEDAELFLHGC